MSEKKELLSVSDTLLVKGSVKLEICKAIRGYNLSFSDYDKYHCVLWVMAYIYFIFNFYLFIFNLFKKFLNLFLAALGLCCCVQAFSSFGKQGLLFVTVRRLLIVVASLVVEHGL